MGGRGRKGGPGVQRGQDDLRQALVERVDLLIVHAERYDLGSWHFAKALAVDLRVLLLDSLLAKLRMLDQTPFYDSTVPFRPDNVFPYHGLVALGYDAVFPAFDDGGPEPRRFIPWQTWASAAAMTSHEGTVFTRKRLIQDGANLEGAHEDLGLPDEYHALTRGVGLGYFSTDEGLSVAFRTDGRPVDVSQEQSLLPNPVPAALRQISHEVLVSLAAAHPSIFPPQHDPHQFLVHHPARFGIRDTYTKRTDGPSSEPILTTFNHPLDPSQFA